MGELGVLFNPGMRHEQEEKLAKQMLREDEGTGRKGRLGIDLESGVVVIGAVAAPSPAERPESVTTDRSTDADDTKAEPRPAGDSGPGRTTAADDAPGRGGSRVTPRSSATVPSGTSRTVPSGKSRRRAEADGERAAPSGKVRRRDR